MSQHAAIEHASSILVGVSDSAYQSEGGLNGPGEPHNNWATWERCGRATPAGIANEFWHRYPEHLDAAVEAGCTAYRTSVEWARCEPTRGVLDTEALSHYARILRACQQRGLEPVLALHHFTHPAWLGADFWLREDAPLIFRSWARVVVEHLGEYCTKWVTINEINAAAIGTYLIGYFPPGRRLQRRNAVAAMDNMLAAHVAAYEEIHAVQPDASVGTSSYAFWSYDADRLLGDVLVARSHGVERADVTSWLAQRRENFHDQVLASLPAHHAWRDRLGHWLLAKYLQVDRRLPRALDAIYASQHERCSDVAQVSWYDPRLATYPRLPGRDTIGGRRWGPDPAHWEQTPSPQYLVDYLHAIHEPDQDIWILENGMCNASIDGSRYERPDGWDRPAYLQAHVQAVREAIASGLPVRGYFHWSMFDNYQWGDFESCFGLRGVDREHGCKLLELDSMGRDSVEIFARLANALRSAAIPSQHGRPRDRA